MLDLPYWKYYCRAVLAGRDLPVREPGAGKAELSTWVVRLARCGNVRPSAVATALRVGVQPAQLWERLAAPRAAR